jgi:protein SCO1/2
VIAQRVGSACPIPPWALSDPIIDVVLACGVRIKERIIMEKTTRPLTVIAAFAASLAIGLLVTLWLAGGFRGAAAPAAIGGPFQLTDQAGQTVTEKSLVGRPSIIFFGFTHCPDVCPTSLFEMSEVLRAMGPDADKVNAFFVSVDPERDTSQAMKDYLSSFDPHLRGLTGSNEAIARVISAYRVYAKKVPLKDGDYTMDHTALIYLMDREGKFVRPFDLKRKPEEAAADLKRYL